MNLDRLDRATRKLGERVLSLSRLVSASSLNSSSVSSPAKMTIRRCSTCHLYIDGAPELSLVHDGKYGPECTSDHHPAPCDHSGKDGVCQFYGTVQGKVEQLSSAQLQARDQVRQSELDKMAAELVSIKQNQVGMDKMSSDLQELKKMILDLRPPPPQGGSLASQPPPVITVAAPPPSIGGAAGGFPTQSSLLDDVEKHIEQNTVPPPSTQPRGQYSGPTMNDLRKDGNVTQIAQQVLAVLEQNIPQIRQNFAPLPAVSAAQSAGNTVSSMFTTTRVTQALQPSPFSSVLPPQQSVAAMESGHPAYDALLSGVRGGGAAQSSPSTMPGAAVVSGPADDFLDASQIMQLCTVSNRKQLRPHEFARLGRFSYASKITDKNITVPLFVMGYLQHVVALLRGIVPAQSPTEVVDRLINLMTIMEITANNSTLEDFKSPGWSIGLEYAGRH